MSISRSTYQKVVEENKRLKRDLKILTYGRNNFDVWHKTFTKWLDYFEEEERMDTMMKKVVSQYIKDHADELPDLLTGPGQK